MQFRRLLWNPLSSYYLCDITWQDYVSCVSRLPVRQLKLRVLCQGHPLPNSIPLPTTHPHVNYYDVMKFQIRVLNFRTAPPNCDVKAVVFSDLNRARTWRFSVKCSRTDLERCKSSRGAKNRAKISQSKSQTAPYSRCCWCASSSASVSDVDEGGPSISTLSVVFANPTRAVLDTLQEDSHREYTYTGWLSHVQITVAPCFSLSLWTVILSAAVYFNVISCTFFRIIKQEIRTKKKANEEKTTTTRTNFLLQQRTIQVHDSSERLWRGDSFVFVFGG